MLSEIDLGFKVKNFTEENMEKLEGNWERVRDSLLTATRLLHDFGYDSRSLMSHNAIIPIAYYLQQIGAGDSYRTRSRFEEDRNNVRLWVARTLLKRPAFWGYSSDTLLAQLRKAIKEVKQPSFGSLDLGSGDSKIRSVKFSSEEIEELADLDRGDRRIHALLLFLFSETGSRGGTEIDHIFPKSAFYARTLNRLDISKEEQRELRTTANKLGNLQLLDRNSNRLKGDLLPTNWLSSIKSSKTRDRWIEDNVLQDLPEDVRGFANFFEGRTAELRKEIERLLKD